MKLLLIFVTIISISKAYPPETNIYGGEGFQIDEGHLQLHASGGRVDPATEARRLADKTARITNWHSENNGHQYEHAFETDNGISAHEAGTVGDGTQAHGSYSYTDDKGEVIAVSYTADEHGFRPSGNHLPTPQPLPLEIAKSLEENAADEARGIYDDGSYRHHQYVQDPHESLLNQYQHEGHVTQEPYGSHVTQYQYDSRVTLNPHESPVNQQYGGFDGLNFQQAVTADVNLHGDNIHQLPSPAFKVQIPYKH